MLTGLWRRAVRRAHASRTRGLDEGFTLVEVLVSIALITIVTTALTTFFLTTTSATGQQSIRQTRSGGLCESVTTAGFPTRRSASWIAAQIAWIAAPPPSPIPFVPSEENGDGLST